MPQGIEIPKRLMELKGQSSRCIREHTHLDPSSQLDGAYLRWVSERTLEQVGMKPISSGFLGRARDVIHALPSYLRRRGSLSDLTSVRELSGNVLLQKEDIETGQEKIEIPFILRTENNANLAKADIVLIVPNSLTVIMGAGITTYRRNEEKKFSPIAAHEAMYLGAVACRIGRMFDN